jgi:hypothetical protein
MTDAMGTAPLNGLPDALFTERFSGMNGDIEIFSLDIVERIDVPLRWESPLLPGQIESHDSTLAKIHGQLRHLGRELHVPHGADNQAVFDTKLLFSVLETLQHSVHHIVPMQALAGMEDWGKPCFDIHDSVLVHVLHHFVSDALEAFVGLHHATGVREAFEIERQTAPLGAAVKPRGQVARIGRRQRVVTLILRQLDDRLRPQPAIEMVVQQNLWQRSNEGLGKLHEAPFPLSIRATEPARATPW